MNTLSELLKAYKFRQKKNYREAITVYESLAKNDPKSEYYYAIGLCYEEMKRDAWSPKHFYRTQDAILSYEKSLEINANNQSCLLRLAFLYAFVTVDYEKCLEVLERCLQVNSNNVLALEMAASLYGVPENVVQIDQAIFWLEKAVSLDNSDPDRALNLAKLYIETGHKEKASALIIEALTMRKMAMESDTPVPMPSRFIDGSNRFIEGLITKLEHQEKLSEI